MLHFSSNHNISGTLSPIKSLWSGEDLKSNIDNLNESNKSLVPVPDSTKNVMDMEEATASKHIPKLCDCLKGACEVEEAGGATLNNS